MIVHNVAQGSQEWIDLRAGRFTATDNHGVFNSPCVKPDFL